MKSFIGLGTYNPVDIISEISKYGIIAGSSLVYALNPDINEFGDIDVFILNANLGNLRLILQLLINY